MIKNNLKVLLIVSIGLMAIVSGCTGGQDVTSAFKALPEVQQFMNEHPNAKITVTYWSQDDVAKSSQEINQQCDKPITPIAMYKATISEGDLKIVSWINAENHIVVCSTTQGSGSSQTINPTHSPVQTQNSASTVAPTSASTVAPTSASTVAPTSADIVVPTASIVAASNPDTPAADMKIAHKGGDTIKAGEWKLSIVPVGNPPVFIASSNDFSSGNTIIATTTTEHATGLTNIALTGVVPLSSGAKYAVKFVHIPSNAMLVDTVIQVR